MSLSKALTAAAGNAAGESLYVEDVFSTYLFTAKSGTTDNGDMVNGINLADEGGMVWIKDRTEGYPHNLIDTERGNTKRLQSQSSAAQSDTGTYGLLAFNQDGFELGTGGGAMWGRDTGNNQVASWTFRKAEKFFDVVTYTGNGVAGRTVAHNLGSTPAVIIVKRLTGLNDWFVYHSSLGATKALKLNKTDDTAVNSVYWNDTEPTDSVFSVGTFSGVNTNTVPYVAYLFASDAGGFGDDGSESIIKCGSYVGTGTAGLEIDLGFEPQWLLVKSSTIAGGYWSIYDNMRGLPVGSADSRLHPNRTDAENTTFGDLVTLLPNGFSPSSGSNQINQSGDTYIYMAIRRPMKTPESGTEVFAAAFGNDSGSSPPTFSLGFTPDAVVGMWPPASWNGAQWFSRLTGNKRLISSGTAVEATQTEAQWDYMDGAFDWSNLTTYFAWMFKRATGFFDVACHTSDGVTESYPHNLGVIPELKIIKNRGDGTVNWVVGGSVLGAPTNRGYYLYLNTNSAMDTNDTFFDQNDTASVYGVRSNNSSAGGINNNTYVAYLFATLAGVSKVGSYTGTGADLNVDCGFSAGARFVMIKRADSTGDWYTWDSTRGIVAGNDPYLLMNSAVGQVTSTDYIDPLASGFTVTSSAPAALNASGGSYIFLAIA